MGAMLFNKFYLHQFPIEVIPTKQTGSPSFYKMEERRRYKTKKNPETVISNLKVDNSLLLKRSRGEYMLKNIRIFGVEAVWKQTILPPHLSNIYQSDGYKAVFLSVEGGGKSKKNLGEEKISNSKNIKKQKLRRNHHC